MIGISYITDKEAKILRQRLEDSDSNKYSKLFWEELLFDNKSRMYINAKIDSSDNVVEINTYEQLRDLDSGSNHLKHDAIKTIANALECNEKDIVNISVLKKGMTNRSFLFDVRKKKYIMRIPGIGTDMLISRIQEEIVYKTIRGTGLCDDPIYINPVNGYKITAYLNNVRVCNPYDDNDLKKCMKKLRYFHELKLEVPHYFDLFKQIEFYENLWDGELSIYDDYNQTKNKIFSLKKYIDSFKIDYCLTHIDAVPDNFLFYDNGEGEELQLTDWEYAGMQDPHVDVAMFCIYSLYEQNQCDRLIDIYFEDLCDNKVKAKIYCYIAICGLLWSNWCEYKRRLGVDFGEYSIRQYRYAKEYYKHATEIINKEKSENKG